MKRLGPAVAIALLALAAATARGDDRVEMRGAQEQARAAYDKKDYAGFLQHSATVARLAPRSTRALYNLACAQALSGHPQEALALLDRLARMGLALDAAADSDFASIKDRPRFRELAGRFAAAGTPIEKSALAFTLPQRDLITEGIAHDPASGDFFVSTACARTACCGCAWTRPRSASRTSRSWSALTRAGTSPRWPCSWAPTSTTSPVASTAPSRTMDPWPRTA